jgi:hypothetical protein
MTVASLPPLPVVAVPKEQHESIRRRRTRTLNLRYLVVPTLSPLSYPPSSTVLKSGLGNRKQLSKAQSDRIVVVFPCRVWERASGAGDASAVTLESMQPAGYR